MGNSKTRWAVIAVFVACCGTSEAVLNVDIRNVASSSGGTWSSGVWTPTASPSTIAISDLLARLVTGNVTIGTGSTGAEAGNISFIDPINRANASTTFSRTLTLNAAGGVTFNATLNDTSGSRQLSLVVNTANTSVASFAADVSTSGGSITTNGGSVSLSTSRSLVTSGGIITLTSAGAVLLNGAAVTTSGGALTVTSNADSSIAASVTTGGGNASVVVSGAGADLTVSGNINVSGGTGVGTINLR